jgi:putative SOS response-associated peptidase YedK
MCSNFQAVTRNQAAWVKQHFQLELPFEDWREEVYPSYVAPFVWLEDGQVRCDLAEFGLVPAWAATKPKFGMKTYNARSETVAEKPSYRNAWQRKQFGLALMQGFYEPNYESGKAVRYRIKRVDGHPLAVASIWERFIDHSTGEIRFSFSMLTVNATHHPVMKQFHAPEDEKRSIVVLQDCQYGLWLRANHEQARSLMVLAPESFLESGSAPRIALNGKLSD